MRRFLVCLVIGCGNDVPAPGPSSAADLGELESPAVDLSGLGGSQCFFWPAAEPVSQIAGGAADDLFGLTQSGKLVHSRDRFATQTVLATPREFEFIDRSTAGTLFATAAGGLYRSSDAGKTWSGVALPAPAQWLRAFSDGAVYVVSSESGLMVSHDDGDHWSTLTVGAPAPLDQVYAAGNDIFVAVSVPSSGGFDAVVIHSGDGGATWSTATVATGTIVASLWGSSPDDVYLVGFAFAGGGVARRSTDRGANWTPLTVTDDRMAQVRGSGSRVYVMTSSAAFFSDDHGATWTSLCQFPSSPAALWPDPSGGAMAPTGSVVALLP